jgi:anti-sigma factor RsiW
MPDVHPVALLLPWYVNGTLSAPERQHADEHLANCASCRAELTELQSVREQVRAAAIEQAVPDTFNAARRHIQRHAVPDTAAQPTRRGDAPGVVGVVRRGLRTLFAPQWVPAAALALVLVQSAALLWMSQRTPDQAQISSRGLAAPATRIKLSFQPASAEKDLRQLLGEIHAHVVGGPTPDGEYIIEVPTTDAARVAQKLATLRAREDLVRSAERVTP